MKNLLIILSIAFLFSGCGQIETTADTKDAERQEKLQSEGSAQIGMPNIHNFQEKKMVKMLYELRDNPKLINYAYTFSEVTGKTTYLGRCIGYGIPYSTQFSNPEKDIYATTVASVHHNMPQAEPNGLFMPSSSDGTWLMLVDPATNTPVPVYIEPKIIVSPFKIQ